MAETASVALLALKYTDVWGLTWSPFSVNRMEVFPITTLILQFQKTLLP